MIKWLLAWRYLGKRRLAFFGIAAVMLCVALLITVTSLFHGFIATYLEHSHRLWGDVLLVPPIDLTEADYSGLAEHLESQPAIERVSFMAQTGGLLYLRPGDVRAVQLVGVDTDGRAVDAVFRQGLLRNRAVDHDASRDAEIGGETATGVIDFTLTGETAAAARTALSARGVSPDDGDWPVGAILGIGLLGQPESSSDEYDRSAIKSALERWEHPLLILTAGRAGAAEGGRSTTTSVQRETIIAWPIDAVETGLHDADTRFVYLPFSTLSDIIGRRDEQGLSRCKAYVRIRSAGGVTTEEVMAAAEAGWASYDGGRLSWVSPTVLASESIWGVRLFIGEIRKQLAIWEAMLGLICLVVSFLVFVTLYMMVMQKKRDIGILRCLGVSRSGLAGVYLLFGGAIGIVGTGLGLVLGLLAVEHINAIEGMLSSVLGFKVWKSGVYMFSTIPNEVAWQSVAWIVPVGIAAAVVGALAPAVRTSRFQPVEALRYE